jgi:hypothetical protein
LLRSWPFARRFEISEVVGKIVPVEVGVLHRPQ